ncbi:hypothetical protein J2Z60_001078 [Lactobacillus colini]|uniref:Phage protein n=1 Tax=Lactobacillus colini TaxID=1819254 RepID=A0ABS4MDZ4_9LACO|nr:hypothetical protein [Lactobacillus colini]MBP2057903.1 hypothetical protein [Lactobacillus colini]
MASQHEIQSGWYKGIEKLLHGIYAGIKVAYLATVVKYNPKKHVADILPLVIGSDGQKSAQFLDIPVAKSCYYLDEWFDKVSGEFAKIDAKTGSNLSKKIPPESPKKPIMHKGAVVVVVVLDRDSDNWDGAKPFKLNSSRLHDSNDSIIVGVM